MFLQQAMELNKKEKKIGAMLLVMGAGEKPVDHYPLVHVGTHSEYRNDSEDETKEEQKQIETCELPTWIMTLLNLKENDIVEVERVHLPMASLIRVQLSPELRSLDVQASAGAQHHIQQQLSDHFDTLTEGSTIPVEWKDNIVEILIVAVFTIILNKAENRFVLMLSTFVKVVWYVKFNWKLSMTQRIQNKVLLKNLHKTMALAIWQHFKL